MEPEVLVPRSQETPSCPYLWETNAVDMLTPYLVMIHFKIILHVHLGLANYH
jgi:hypothetical protein